MNEFITIMTCTYSTEAEMVKNLLESAGVHCYIRDSYITQVNPLYSDALGGIRIQVRQQDIDAATTILADRGYLKQQKPGGSLLDRFIAQTGKVPFLESSPPVIRFLIVIGFCTLAFLLIGYYLTSDF